MVGGKRLHTCLGDLFEVNWMGDSERRDAKETLAAQFARVKRATNKSHVMHYGQVKAFMGKPIAEFQGPGKKLSSAMGAERDAPTSATLDARLVELDLLYREYARTGSREAGDRLIV